jgi:GYF domain 2
MSTTPEEKTIYLGINSQKEGPFTKAEVMEKLQEGKIQHGTLCWSSGMSGWTPVQQFLGLPGATPPLPPLPPTVTADQVGAYAAQSFNILNAFVDWSLLRNLGLPAVRWFYRLSVVLHGYIAIHIYHYGNQFSQVAGLFGGQKNTFTVIFWSVFYFLFTLILTRLLCEVALALFTLRDCVLRQENRQ